jgi:hypothetical protein
MTSVAQPQLVLASPGKLKRFTLSPYGRSRQLIPPGALVRLADALGASPHHDQVAAAVKGLRELAGTSIGHPGSTGRRER